MEGELVLYSMIRAEVLEIPCLHRFALLHGGGRRQKGRRDLSGLFLIVRNASSGEGATIWTSQRRSLCSEEPRCNSP